MSARERLLRLSPAYRRWQADQYRIAGLTARLDSLSGDLHTVLGALLDAGQDAGRPDIVAAVRGAQRPALRLVRQP